VLEAFWHGRVPFLAGSAGRLKGEAMAESVTALGFTITPEGSGCASTRGPKHFLLDPSETKCVRIGRAPGNDIQVELRGCSQFHAEIRVLPPKDEDSPPRLVVRDLSMNGTGLKHGDKPAVQTKKEKDVQLYHGAQILVPMQLKQNQAPTDRAWLKVDFDDPDLGAARQSDDAQADADAGGGPAPRKKSGGKEENGDKEGDKENDDSDDKEEDKPDDKEEDDEDGDDEDGEKTRTQFVDLLMKAKEISAGTTYEDAEGLLSKRAAWKAVDEQTRRECFEIFVDHLATHTGKKKKKKDKAKKGKKRKHKGTEEEAVEDDDEDAPRKKKKSKKGERRKKARSKSS